MSKAATKASTSEHSIINWHIKRNIKYKLEFPRLYCTQTISQVKYLKRKFYEFFLTKILFHREHITESSVLKTSLKYFEKNINFMTTAVVINNFQRKYY